MILHQDWKCQPILSENFDPKPQFSLVSSWFPGYFLNVSSNKIIIFGEISAIAFQNGTEHHPTTSGRGMTVILFQENIVISQNSAVPIDEPIESQDHRSKNISRQEKALTSRVFGVSCTAGYQEVSRFMLGYHRTKKNKKETKILPVPKKKTFNN